MLKHILISAFIALTLLASSAYGAGFPIPAKELKATVFTNPADVNNKRNERKCFITTGGGHTSLYKGGKLLKGSFANIHLDGKGKKLSAKIYGDVSEWRKIQSACSRIYKKRKPVNAHKKYRARKRAEGKERKLAKNVRRAEGKAKAANHIPSGTFKRLSEGLTNSFTSGHRTGTMFVVPSRGAVIREAVKVAGEVVWSKYSTLSKHNLTNEVQYSLNEYRRKHGRLSAGRHIR